MKKILGLMAVAALGLPANGARVVPMEEKALAALTPFEMDVLGKYLETAEADAKKLSRAATDFYTANKFKLSAHPLSTQYLSYVIADEAKIVLRALGSMALKILPERSERDHYWFVERLTEAQNIIGDLRRNISNDSVLGGIEESGLRVPVIRPYRPRFEGVSEFRAAAMNVESDLNVIRDFLQDKERFLPAQEKEALRHQRVMDIHAGWIMQKDHENIINAMEKALESLIKAGKVFEGGTQGGIRFQ